MDRAGSRARMPVVFVGHGTPMNAIADNVWSRAFAELGRELPRPRAILAVSGHWETDEFTVQTHPHPPMYYDYGGFPEFTYHIEYPAPGAPDVAERVVDLLAAADIPVHRDSERGFDHGVFAPFAVV